MRRTSGLCPILWIVLTSCTLTFFFNVFCNNNNARFSVELLRFDDCLKFEIAMRICFLYKCYNKSNRSIQFKLKKNHQKIASYVTSAELRFKPETEISMNQQKTSKKNVKAQEVKPIHKMSQMAWSSAQVCSIHDWLIIRKSNWISEGIFYLVPSSKRLPSDNFSSGLKNFQEKRFFEDWINLKIPYEI